MSILENMQESARSAAPVYMEFLKRFNPKKKQIFVFFEGNEDGSFYEPIINAVASDKYEVEYFVANCKNNVLGLQDRCKCKSNKVIFFVDRDLSHWLEDEREEYDDNIFVTEGYSVENYIANRKGLDVWLRHFEGFAGADKEEIGGILDDYEKIEAEYRKKMLPVMAAAIVAKRHNKKISLDEVKIVFNRNIVFNADDGHLGMKFQTPANLKVKWGIEEIHNEEIDKQIKALTKEERKYFVRGKWHLTFMAEVGEYVRMNYKVFAKSLYREGQGKLTPTCSVPTRQCLPAIAPHFASSPPKDLELFLKRTIGSFIATDKNDRQ